MGARRLGVRADLGRVGLGRAGLGRASTRTTAGPGRRPPHLSSRPRRSGPYLSSETLMTPSSLGTITAIFTTSWDPSTRCSRTGLRVRGLGWISAAIGGGAPRGRAEDTARARADTGTGDGRSEAPGTHDHSLAAALGKTPRSRLRAPPPLGPELRPGPHQRGAGPAGGGALVGAGLPVGARAGALPEGGWRRKAGEGAGHCRPTARV